MLYMLSTIHWIILTSLTQGALQDLTSAVDCDDSKAKKALDYIWNNRLTYFQWLHWRTSLQRSRCVFTGFVAQVEQPMCLTDEAERKEQQNVGRIFFFSFAPAVVFSNGACKQGSDRFCEHKKKCLLFLIPFHCQWTDFCSLLFPFKRLEIFIYLHFSNQSDELS